MDGEKSVPSVACIRPKLIFLLRAIYQSVISFHITKSMNKFDSRISGCDSNLNEIMLQFIAKNTGSYISMDGS